MDLDEVIDYFNKSIFEIEFNKFLKESKKDYKKINALTGVK